MATTDRNTLKQWFLRGLKPLAAQFAAWIDSYWHKDDKIPIASIEDLQQTLNNKIEQSEIDAVKESITQMATDIETATQAANEAREAVGAKIIKTFTGADIVSAELSIELPWESEAPKVILYNESGVLCVDMNIAVRKVDLTHVSITFPYDIDGTWTYRIEK